MPYAYMPIPLTVHCCVRQVARPMVYSSDQATATSDRDGLIVMGELTTEKLKITGFKLWSGGLVPDFLGASKLHKKLPERVFLDCPFIDSSRQQAPFHFAKVAKLANGKVIIIDSGKDQDAQQAYRWLVPEDIQDEPAVASQLEMPRELRTALILRGEVVLDTRQRKKVSEHLDYHKAIVIDPAMINFMSAEPYPVYVREFYVNASGLHQFRQPTVDEMLHQIKHC